MPLRAHVNAPEGNHGGPQRQSIAPLGKSCGATGVIMWSPRGNHVGPPGKSHGTPGAITWAPRGNHVVTLRE